MALDERYIVASDLEQYFVDKDSGLPLANGTISFFRDLARNVPKPVFQLSGAPPNYTYTSMGSIITLSGVGTVQNSGGDNEVIYYFPFDDEGNLDLYYAVIRDENGIEQFTREAWPNITAANDPTRDAIAVPNQLSNPQFTKVFINEGLSTTFTVSAAVSQVFELGPNWDFVISGTGTVVVERIAIPGNDNVVTSPPYVLDINVSNGITECLLRQRLNVNSGLWASTANEDIFLAGNVVARNEVAGTTGIEMFYVESSGGSPITILSESFDSSNYVELMGTTADPIPLSNNTDSGIDGYVDIYLSILPSDHIRISSIQVVPTLSNASTNIVEYDTQSSNREQAMMGDYFIPRLVAKQIPSIMIGWDFTVNPYQFGTSGNIAGSAAYICDQTISAGGSADAYAISSVTGGLQFTTVGTNTAFYVLQYLTGAQAKKVIGARLSANVFAYKGSVGDDVEMKIYLFRGSAAANIPALPADIGTLSTAGVFTLTEANWTAIPRSGLDTATATLNTVTVNSDINEGNDYGFSGWEITDSTQLGDTDKICMVVTFAYISASTVITLNSISLVPGDLPCRPGEQSQEEVLKSCQAFYESSYPPRIAAGTVTGTGVVFEQIALTSGGNVHGGASVFGIIFNTPKRTDPVIEFYAPGTLNASALITMNVYTNATLDGTGDVASSSWTVTAGRTNINAVAATGSDLVTAPASSATKPFSQVFFNYTADARLGIV
jgi:hypothetical protein